MRLNWNGPLGLERLERFSPVSLFTLPSSYSFLSIVLGLLPETKEPFARLVYQGLTEEELEALERASETADEMVESSPRLASTPHVKEEDSSDDSSSDGDGEGDGDQRMHVDQEDRKPVLPLSVTPSFVEPPAERREDEHWQPGTLPDHVYGFLPPFPGAEQSAPSHHSLQPPPRASTSTAHLPLMIPHAEPETSPLASSDAWRESVPFETSEMAKLHQSGVLPALSPTPSRAASPDLPLGETDSLRAFYQVYARVQPTEVDEDDVKYGPSVTLKRKLASTLQQHALQLSDSLYASVPVPGDRSASHSAGWFPYRPPRGPDDPPGYYVYPQIHPFEGPFTQGATEPVPSSLATDPALQRLLAPARAPYPLSHLAQSLTNAQPLLAQRSLRMAPPGPVDNEGRPKPLELEYIDPTVLATEEDEPRYLAWGFQWRPADYTDPSLPLSTAPEFDAGPPTGSRPGSLSRSGSVAAQQIISHTSTPVAGTSTSGPTKINLKIPRPSSVHAL